MSPLGLSEREGLGRDSRQHHHAARARRCDHTDLALIKVSAPSEPEN